MIHAHRVIEAMRRRLPGTHPPLDQYKDTKGIDSFANLIEAAEKFDFGPLVLEKDQKEAGRCHLPDFTQTEWKLWGWGLVPLPSNPSWFEYQLGTSRTGLLVYKHDDEVANLSVKNRWCVVRFELAPTLWWDAVMVAVEQRPKFGETMSTAEMHTDWLGASALSNEQKRDLWGDQVHTSIYLTLMLGSKTTEKKLVNAPSFTNKLREKKGKLPLQSHTVVRIVPHKFITESQKGAGRTHATPRLHWRRSHLRVYDHHTPASTYVEGKGWCVAIPRCLVGAAELGEVSHEYFVEKEHKKELVT